ncbi:hypothetical protein [Actinophytocola sp. NPDC049390]|uniref:hypothetical protein n=1 Tax=Actinophytocola sp. NPDC049390 TaxID=3363894 RepID=UPI0037B23505
MMGLFDAIREKAAELVSGATEKVGELTGTDPADAAQNLGDTAQGYADEASGVGQNLAGTATDSVQNVTDAATDTPLGNYVDPRDGQ